MNVIHHQPQDEALGIDDDDALVFLDVLRDLPLKPPQGFHGFPCPGERFVSGGASRFGIAALLVPGAGVQLLGDLFVEPPGLGQRLHQQLAGTIGFGQPLAKLFGDGIVHLRLRAGGEGLFDLGDPVLVLLAERPAVVGEFIGERALLEKPPQVDDGENLAAHGQHTQYVVRNVGDLVGSLHAENLADMLHVEREFLFGDAEGDQFPDIGVVGLRLVGRLAAAGFRTRSRAVGGGRLTGHAEFADLGRIQGHDDALTLIELDHAFEIVRGGAADGRRRGLDFAAHDASHLFDAVDAQAGLDAVDIDDQYAGAVGLLGALHAETGAHVDDGKDDAAQIGDAVHVGRRAGNFRHLGKANDFLYRHDVEAELFVLQQERDQLAFVLQAGGWL
ncbi:MAG: hypothetical protein ABSC05_10790 [Candidatus Solibacter sp.]